MRKLTADQIAGFVLGACVSLVIASTAFALSALVTPSRVETARVSVPIVQVQGAGGVLAAAWACPVASGNAAYWLNDTDAVLYFSPDALNAAQAVKYDCSLAPSPDVKLGNKSDFTRLYEAKYFPSVADQQRKAVER